MSRLLTVREVMERVRMSRSTLYRLMRLGRFPEPVRVGLKAVRWKSDEIDQFLNGRPRAEGEVAA